jgi:hypothetical protein
MTLPKHVCEPGSLHESDLASLLFAGLVEETFGRRLAHGAARWCAFVALTGGGDPHVVECSVERLEIARQKGLGCRTTAFRARSAFHQLAKAVET